MKTGKEIVKEFNSNLNTFSVLSGRTPIEDIIDSAILEIRKEQDRLTRHACAEAIINCDEGANSISYSTAEHLCLNVKAV